MSDYQINVVAEVLGQKVLIPLEMAPNEMDLMRIDLTKGYTAENTILCSHAAVMLRESFFEDMPFEEFQHLCKEIRVTDEIIRTARAKVGAEVSDNVG